VKKSIVTTCAFILICIFSFSQNLNGFWKGTLSMQGCFPENNIELQISIKDNSSTGDSYHYQDINNYVKKKFNGSYDATTKKLNLQEGIVTTYHIPGRCVICIKNYDLTYSKNGNIETLSGNWTGNVQNTALSCEGGRIILTRIAESAFKEIPEIKVDTGTIRLDFYDNAIIDGDSITILVNKQVVLTHQRLSAKPITTYLRIDLQNTFHEVEMVAENLGSTPPNTAILIITAGKKRYLLSLSASDTKRAIVRFVYDGDVVNQLETMASIQ
jgi:hypothetical protein